MCYVSLINSESRGDADGAEKHLTQPQRPFLTFIPLIINGYKAKVCQTPGWHEVGKGKPTFSCCQSKDEFEIDVFSFRERNLG